MGAEDIPRLQQFFELNSEYHLAVGGEVPKPTEAQEEFESLPPAGWPFERRWLLGFVDNDRYRTVVLSPSELQIPAMRLYQSSGYRLVRSETSADPSHKTVGAGLTRYHYEKSLSPGA